MLCNQCEQRAIKHDNNHQIISQGCTNLGVCGKSNEVANLQDTLIYALRLLAATSIKADEKNIENKNVDHFIIEALFGTLTNVNFSEESIIKNIKHAIHLRKEIAKELGCTPTLGDEAEQEAFLGLQKSNNSIENFSDNEDVRSAMQTLLYGIKGVAAYTWHSQVLGKEDDVIYSFIKRALTAGFPNKQGEIEQLDLQDWLDLLLECGSINVRAMEILEEGHTEHFGHPTPTPVSLGQKAGKAILVSGHDLQMLYELLKQTEGTGINIYTHGEMLPAHGYPKLKKFKHLVGHFGTAWQNQQKEFVNFPGAILFTSNCIQNPKGYADKVFTAGAVHFDGVGHFDGTNFRSLIEKALSLEGFKEDIETKTVNVGFGRQTLLDASSQVLDAVSDGAIRHIFLVGGCDGAKTGRNYFTEFVEKTPADSLVLTLGCGKYRFFDKDLGVIGAFPRLMDVGQCNDAYAAVQIALALSKALNCTVNDLPLSLVISWYEQKAVAVFLSLLALGVKNVYLGPSLPAFISSNILQILIEKWDIKATGNVDEDMKRMLA